MTSYPNIKINLGLRVLRRRPDGYHDLETLFVPCDAYRDELEINEYDGSDGDVRISIANCGWDPYSDLTVKAYRLLKSDFPDLPPVEIRLVKNSPVGAGLGGGSADCAFALRMTSDLFGLGLSDDALASYAACLGSDCAFFVYNRPMFAEGRGEILTDYPVALEDYDIRVGIPDEVHVSTREAYGGIVPRENGSVTLRDVLALPVEDWRDSLVNDFETTVFAVHPEIAALKQKFYEDGAVYAAMSGSGSAVFGLFRK